MRFIDRKSLTPPELLFDKRTDEARQEIHRWIERFEIEPDTYRRAVLGT